MAINFNSASFPTCYGKEFTDRLFGLRKRSPTGKPEFDMLCSELGIDNRLTQPKSPQTNGIPLGDCQQSPAGQRVERFNGRIADVLETSQFNSALDLKQTLRRYAAPYNTQLPQSALGSRTLLQAMKDWHKSHPHIFVKSPRNLPGRDSEGDF